MLTDLIFSQKTLIVYRSRCNVNSYIEKFQKNFRTLFMHPEFIISSDIYLTATTSQRLKNFTVEFKSGITIDIEA